MKPPGTAPRVKPSPYSHLVMRFVPPALAISPVTSLNAPRSDKARKFDMSTCRGCTTCTARERRPTEETAPSIDLAHQPLSSHSPEQTRMNRTAPDPCRSKPATTNTPEEPENFNVTRLSVICARCALLLDLREILNSELPPAEPYRFYQDPSP